MRRSDRGQPAGVLPRVRRRRAPSAPGVAHDVERSGTTTSPSASTRPARQAQRVARRRAPRAPSCPRRAAASATALGGHGPRRVGLRRPRPSRTPAARSAVQHGQRVAPRQHADHGDGRRRRPRTPRPASGPSAVMPATLCAPSTSSSGRRPDTSSRPGTRTAARPSSTTSASSGAAEERLDRGQRARRVVALVGPVQRHAARPRSGRPGVHRSTSRPPTATRLDVAAEVPPGHPDRGRPRASARGLATMSTRSGVGLPDDHPAARLDDPGLVRPRCPRGSGPSTSVWS